MRLRRLSVLLIGIVLAAMPIFAKPVCIGEMCYPSEEAARAAGALRDDAKTGVVSKNGDEAKIADGVESAGSSHQEPRLASGYMNPREFLAFLRNDNADDSDLSGKPVWLIFLLVLAGGILANLTPCVLPLVPVNLIIVGRGWRRGLAYGFGIATAYGCLGVAAAIGGMAFGTVQSGGWFNLFVSAVFIALALALSGFFHIDLSKFRPRVVGAGRSRGGVGVFFLGAGSAVLAGACVEPILLATLLMTAKGFAQGDYWVVVLPFVLGMGMGLPWPFAAAGMSVLPRPGAWMRWVNRTFAAFLFAMGLWYGMVAFKIFSESHSGESADESVENIQSKLIYESNTSGGKFLQATCDNWDEVFAKAKEKGKPVLVDIWASWCKNCSAMERVTFRDEAVAKEFESFTVIRLEAPNLSGLSALSDFKDLKIIGLPTFVIFPCK